MSMHFSHSAPWSPRPLQRESAHAAAWIDFILIFALALALRLHDLGTKPFWIDEVMTKLRVALPPGQLISDSLDHHHLPAYFLLLSQLSPGVNPWLLRLPSAVAGALAAALGVPVGRRLAEGIGAARTGGLISGLLLAAAPIMVQSGQDARPYSLELAGLMLSLWGLLSLARNAEAAGGTWRRGAGPWSALIIGMIGAFATIGNALPFLLVANVAVWPIARSLSGAARRTFLLRWVCGQAIVLLAVAPMYLAMGHSVDDDYMAAFNWVPPLDGMRAWRVAADVYLLRTANVANLHLLPIGLPILGAVALLLAGAGLIALRRQPAACLIMALAVVALPVLLVVSEPARPLWLPRYLLWSGAAFLLLTALGSAWLARGRCMLASAVAAFLLLLNVRPFYAAETAPRWDLAAAALAPALASGADLFLDDHGVPTMLRAYLPTPQAALVKDRVVYQLGEAEARLRAGVPVIAIHGHTGQERTSRIAAFRAQVGQLGTPAEDVRIGQEIEMIRVDPPPPAAAGPGVAQQSDAPPKT